MKLSYRYILAQHRRGFKEDWRIHGKTFTNNSNKNTVEE